MATLLKVGNTVINLDTVTAIELEARSSTAATPKVEPVVRVHFTAPAFHCSGEATPAAPVPTQTLELGGTEAALLRTYLAYEAVDVAGALAEA